MQSLCQSLVGCLLIVGFGSPATADNTKVNASEPKVSIKWLDDLEQAKWLSAKDGRPVIAYFTFDTCVWCKRLEKACYSDPKVVKLSRKLIWVTINRDRTPAIPKRFNVSAYPSLLVLGTKNENVFRFQSFQEPKEFIGNLKAALKRYELYKRGKKWMLPPERADQIVEAGKVDTLKAPSDSVPSGITEFNGSIWLAQGALFQLDRKSGKVLNRFTLPASVADLCNDGKQIYAVTYGWTAGKPIYIIDPGNGKVIREIVTQENKKNRSHGAKGIAWHAGHLYVLSGMRGKLHKLNLDTGKIISETQLEGTWLSGLDVNNGRFVAGSRDHLIEFDSATGKLIRKTACNYPLRNVATSGSRNSFLLMEQPIFGFGPKHERFQVWPQETKIYQLSLSSQR
jgi:thiol-disulfide isomerase/thioredoxin